MSPDERALYILREYADHLNNAFMNEPEVYFCQTTYGRWATNEILVFVLSNPQLSPKQAVKVFMYKMQRYSKKQKGHKSTIFNIAYNVASDIYDLLCCE